MKVCPQCNSEFDDKVNFCLNDGTPVVTASQREVPTESFSAPLVDEPAVAEPQPTAGYTASTAGAMEQQTGANEPIAPRQPLPAKRRSSAILWVLLAVGLAGLFIVVLGVAGLLYYMVYRQPEVAKVNSNSIVISDANSTGGDSNLSDANSIALSPNSNSALPSNSVTVPTSNTNANAMNRRATPTPAKTIEPRGTPSADQTPPPPPTPERSIPKVISGGVLNGRAISLPKPAYPPAARAVRAGGSVNVQVLIDEEGRVISAHAVGGNPLLIPAAEVAARGARFSPTLLSGQPVKVSGIITYNFVP